jgi:hypothetical protein
VTTLGASADYSLRNLRTVLDLAERGGIAGRPRVVPVPKGTRPGFLSALAEIVHAQAASARAGAVQPGPPAQYLYHGKTYELRGTSVELKPQFFTGSTRYGRTVVGDFTITNVRDNELTRFSIAYAIDGALAEVPLTMSYQPRWWMQINLVLDDE